MKQLFVLSVLALLCLPACKKGPVASIRNPNVYANEIDVYNMIQNQSVQRMRYWLEQSCSCDGEGAWTGDHADECEKTAKHVLVVETRQSFHTALMEYNGSLTDVEPEGDPPEVPETSTLCPAAEPPAEGEG